MKREHIRVLKTLAFWGATVVGASSALAVEKLPEGWFAAGSHPQHYVMGLDHEVKYRGQGSGYIAAKGSMPEGFGTLMQTFKADMHRGKRLRISATIKADEVENWAGLWMRVDGPAGATLSFDNMQDRPIKGTTDWSNYEVVLDVPEASLQISFGILLEGKGRVWIDDVRFEVVDKDVPTTGKTISDKEPQKRPMNLDFETATREKTKKMFE